MIPVVVISPETDDPRESAVVPALFAAGLERYHVRKPTWSREQLETYLAGFSPEARRRMWIHSHHELIASLGLAGVHWRDRSGMGVSPLGLSDHGRDARATFTSRSCHDLESLRASLGQFDSIFFGPVFPSLSKPGYRSAPEFPWTALSALLATRTPGERSTAVIALGGITSATALRALALGFDGVAVLGAVWQSIDPVRAFREIQATCGNGFTAWPNAPEIPRADVPRKPTAAATDTQSSAVLQPAFQTSLMVRTRAEAPRYASDSSREAHRRRS